jgi:hypothetical protein
MIQRSGTVDVLRERAILTDSWAHEIGTWADIYDDEIKKWHEDEVVIAPGRREKVMGRV